ncbi:MAG: class I adenylate-forming enzyme family protein [Ancrocorticia sp.]|uniref:class I adenylate-forming enzyme family protein n=1 Tax=Ancrocorticia sp. TaxID=2593684 RepID=UPI003F8DBEC9
MHKPPIYNAARTLDQAAFAHPDRPSITYGERVLTVAQADELTRQLAHLLAQAGVSTGDRVMLASHNSPYHLLTHIACARLGAVFVPVSFRLTQLELQELVDFVSPRAIICEPEIAARGAFVSTGTLLQFVIDDDVQAGPLSAGFANGYLALGAAMSPHDASMISDTRNTGMMGLNQHGYPDGLAMLMLTSGTVGKPKAVSLTHANLWWGSRNFRDGFEYRTDETVLAVAPFSHIGGFNGTTLDVFTGGGHVVIERYFDPARTLRDIEEHRVNIMFAAPTMYIALVNHPDFATRDLSSWRLPLVGGSQVPAPLLGRLAARGLRPLNVWGMTETAAPGAYLPFEHCPNRPGSIGRPFAYIEARLRDPKSGKDVGQGEIGELLVRGPSVTSGYWHGETYSDDAFVGDWLRTGDLAELDSCGFLSIVGRLLDRIMTGGEGVLPDEVESVLRQLPGVRDAVVCGVPDDVWGELIVAGLELEDGVSEPSFSDVESFASKMLGRYKLPRFVAVFDRIPLTSNDKTDRPAARSIIGALMKDQGVTAEDLRPQ